jgi:hypothetical protein
MVNNYENLGLNGTAWDSKLVIISDWVIELFIISGY